VQRYIAALNACDTETIDGLLADDIRYVDSSGGWLEGRENVVSATRDFFDTGIEFRIDDAKIVLHGDEVLVRGVASARDPELATDKLWKAKVTNGKLSFWQGFGDKGVPFARMVSPEKVGIAYSMQPLFPSKSA